MFKMFLDPPWKKMNSPCCSASKVTNMSVHGSGGRSRWSSVFSSENLLVGPRRFWEVRPYCLDFPGTPNNQKTNGWSNMVCFKSFKLYIASGCLGNIHLFLLGTGFPGSCHVMQCPWLGFLGVGWLFNWWGVQMHIAVPVVRKPWA